MKITVELDANGLELLERLRHLDALLEVSRLELGGKLATRELVNAVGDERDRAVERVALLELELRKAHERIGCGDLPGTNPDSCSICKLLEPKNSPAPARSPDQLFPAQGSPQSCTARTLDELGGNRDCRMWKGHKGPHVDGAGDVEFSWPIGVWWHRCEKREDAIVMLKDQPKCECGEEEQR
jgi:hypothetical protein